LSIDIRYLAGFIDGEGCIEIHRNKRGKDYFNLRLDITQVYKPVLASIQKDYGGYLIRSHGPRPNKSSRWYVEWSGEKAKDLIKLVLPYLIVKKKQAKLAMKFPYVRRGGDPRVRHRYSIEDRKLRKSIYTQMKKLNRGRKKT